MYVEGIIFQSLLYFENVEKEGRLMSSNQKPVAAFVLSLLSGVFIVLGGSLWCLWSGANWEMGWMGMMMHEWDEHMNGWNTESATYTMGIFGIVFGVIIVVLAVMLYTNPVQHELWGALIIVFSVISVLSCMGGMGIGLILGVIGGILAILWKPAKTKQM
jgi:hypothetical protein